MVLKRFAQILGVVLILVGLVGLVLGDRVWLGILNGVIVESEWGVETISLCELLSECGVRVVSLWGVIVTSQCSPSNTSATASAAASALHPRVLTRTVAASSADAPAPSRALVT